MQITTSAQAAQRDADAIASGIDSWSLMYAAGTAAAQVIASIATSVEAPLVWVVAGTGNNGGDAYVVAAELLANDFTVVLGEIGEPRSVDAKRARELYREARAHAGPPPDVTSNDDTARFVVVDGLLGTGQKGALRELEQQYAAHINRFRGDRNIVVALDLPTGVNATTGEIVEDAVRADYTLAFGTMKRAHVLQREQCGEIMVLDIGLGEFADRDDTAWTLADATSLALDVPDISWNSHKGTRGRMAIVGGSNGMAGAVILSAQAALHSGAGLVHAHVHEQSVLALQITVPQAITHAWFDVSARESLGQMHAIAIGPGFGRSDESSQLLRELLGNLPAVPVVLDADALTLLGNNANELRVLCANRDVVCTPHIGEFARLLGKAAADSLAERVVQAHELADDIGATILLKGTPTIVVAPNDETTTVIARGTPALATGGSGDMLTGMIGTLMAQGVHGADAAAIAAYVHGRAAELATTTVGTVRGVTLQEVMQSLAPVWSELTPAALQATPDQALVLAQLPTV